MGECEGKIQTELIKRPGKSGWKNYDVLRQRVNDMEVDLYTEGLSTNQHTTAHRQHMIKLAEYMQHMASTASPVLMYINLKGQTFAKMPGQSGVVLSSLSDEY